MLFGLNALCLRDADLDYAAPWELALHDSCDPESDETPLPLLDRRLMSPLYLSRDYEREIALHWAIKSVQGLDSSHSQDPYELLHVLRHTQWDSSSLSAILCSTVRFKETASTFVARKRAERSWKYGRQMKVAGKKPSNPTQDEKDIFALKSYFCEVVEIAEDKRCVVKVDGFNRLFAVSSCLLYDVQCVFSMLSYVYCTNVYIGSTNPWNISTMSG